MNEIWKDIPGYEGLYQASNIGNVRSLKWNRSNKIKNLKPYEEGGYMHVGIRHNGIHHNYLIHRLVAMAFIPNPSGYKEVNHIDGNKLNNTVVNLEWISRKNNVLHAINTGLRPPNVPCIRKRRDDSALCKEVIQYDLNNNIVARWSSVFKIQEELGFKPDFVRRCCRGERKTYKGFIWSYAS